MVLPALLDDEADVYLQGRRCHQATSHPLTMPANSKTRPMLVDRIRSELHTALGGCCAECGSTSQLEIDHPAGRDWTPRKVSSYGRWLRYRREHAAGLVRLLCHDCNETIRPRVNQYDGVCDANQQPF